MSAFANSDGGILVYGVEEEGHIPIRLDGGVDHLEWSRERLEGIVTGNITPKVADVEIVAIPVSSTHSYYVINVPKSYRGPHQETIAKRYYKRFNFKSQPMEDYEIRDIFARRDVVPPLLNVDVDIHHGVIMYLVVSNIGDMPAEDVRFKIEPPVDELTKSKLLTEGSRFIPPGKRHHFFFGSAIQKIKKEDAPKFDVEVGYFNRRAGQRVTDTFHVDMSDYFWAGIVESDVAELTKKLEEQLKKICEEVRKTNQHFLGSRVLCGPLSG